jgi:prevent-host-death family protein
LLAAQEYESEEPVVPVQAMLPEPGRVDEPRVAKEYSDVLTRVASDHRPVIVRRNGADLAAVVPLEHLELLQDLLARQEAERIASQLDWDRLVKTSPPPQAWFNGDEPKPF